MTRTEKAQRFFVAEVSGRMAFKAGQKRIPVLDKNLMDILKDVDGYSVEILTAWLKGWDIGNVAI